MATTYFLAAILGWYLVIISLFLICRRENVLGSMNNIIAQPGLLLVVAFITLIIGLLMVLSHNVWVLGWPVLVTLFGWIALLSGLIRLFFPEIVHRIWGKMIIKPELFTGFGVVFFIIGLFLLYQVYLR